MREYAHTTPSSMKLRARLPFDAWLGVGRHVSRISSASAWWLGDWIIYGEQEYGKRYKAALDATQLDYQTLRNYAWVARSFEPPRRRETLSFQHHAELASLPEPDQDLWLDRAERLQWSRNELRRQLRLEGRTDLHASDDHAVTLRVPVTTDRELLWRQAAAAADQELVEWIATAADEAAQAALSRASSAEPPRAVEAAFGRSARRLTHNRRLPLSVSTS